MSLILGVESSCDETGVALYDLQKGLLTHILHSQSALHAEYGGVVPELASRDHIRRLAALTRAVLAQAGRSTSDIDAVAYTAGPGLAGALLAGAGFARSMAWALVVPAIKIHHMEAHLLAAAMTEGELRFPFIALLVSGGHTQLVYVERVGAYRLLGETLDDAAGEAFDKVAQLLGLGYPGGPQIEKIAQKAQNGSMWKGQCIQLPRPMLKSENLDFSFSGLKTATFLHVDRFMKEENTPENQQNCEGQASTPISLPFSLRAALAFSFQEAVIDVLVHKSLQALRQKKVSRLVIAGGVGANRLLRRRFEEQAANEAVEVSFPDPVFCTDNGAMIAHCAAMRICAGLKSDIEEPIKTHWPLTDL